MYMAHIGVQMFAQELISLCRQPASHKSNIVGNALIQGLVINKGGQTRIWELHWEGTSRYRTQYTCMECVVTRAEVGYSAGDYG
jgi:hypothetical protein